MNPKSKMKNKVKKIGLFTLAFLLMSPSLLGADYLPSLSVSPSYEAEDLNLCFVLIYNGNKPTKIYKSDLPWGAGRTFAFHPTVINPNGQALEKLVYIADPLADTMQLEPHHTYTGILNLTAMYKNIEEVHMQSDILLDWSYTLRDWNGTNLSTIYGKTLIPKLQIQGQTNLCNPRKQS